MKLINRETIKGTVSAKSMSLASVLLTGAIALTATGCDAQIKADGITIDSLTITGSDADGILEGADITINGQNVDLKDIAVPTQAVKQADPADNGNTVTPSNDKAADTQADNTASAPADSISLYDAFLKGNAVTGRYWFGEFNDYNYTIEDLIDMAEHENSAEVDRDNCVSYRLIDCGADGNQELLVSIEYNIGYDATEYFLIKDFNGKLYITSSMDSWYRHWVEIEDNGKVTISYSSGAYDHDYMEGFYDAEGKYNQIYRCNTVDIAPSHNYFYFLDANNELHWIGFYTDGLDVPYKEFSIKELCIGENSTPVYTYCIWDEDGKDITTDADFESTARIVNIMNIYGFKVYDHSTMEKLVFEQADEYGLMGESNVSLDISKVLNRK